MRKYIIIILQFVWILTCYAQHENQFTQFGDAKLFYNPAVAAAEENFSVTLRHRNQWSGLQGAPTGQTILLSFPNIYEAVSLGLTASRNTVGISQRNDISGMYAYQLKFLDTKVQLGLLANFRQFINDFTDDNLIAIDGFENDDAVDQLLFSRNLFNVGAGVHIDREKFYAGVSVPRLVQSNLDFDSDANQAVESRILYAMFGLRFDLGPTWSFRQHSLLKLSERAPTDLDLQAQFIYENQAHLGLNIRSGGSQSSLLESVGVLLGFKFTPQLFAMMSYDFNTTELQDHQNGSFEILLRYDLKKTKLPKNIQNPRYY